MEECIRKLNELRCNGFKSREICKYTGISETTLSRLLNRRLTRINSLTKEKINNFYDKVIKKLKQ